MNELEFIICFTGDSYIVERNEDGEEVDRIEADFGTICGFFEILKNQPYNVQKQIRTLTALEVLAEEF